MTAAHASAVRLRDGAASRAFGQGRGGCAPMSATRADARVGFSAFWKGHINFTSRFSGRRIILPNFGGFGKCFKVAVGGSQLSGKREVNKIDDIEAEDIVPCQLPTYLPPKFCRAAQRESAWPSRCEAASGKPAQSAAHKG